MNGSKLGLAVLAVLPVLLVPACNNSNSGGRNFVNLAGPQVGSITVNIATGKVTAVQPQALILSGTAVLTPSPAATLTVSLKLKNRSTQILFNPKMLVTNLNEGTTTGDGTFGTTEGGGGGDPYAYYGPESMKPGASETRDIVITGVSGGIDITFDVEILLHPMFFVTGGFDDLIAVDSSGTDQTFLIDGEPVSYNTDDMMFYDGVSSPNGRFIYMGSRNQPALTVVDTTKLTPTMGKDLTGKSNVAFDSTGTIGYVDAVTMSPDGKFLFAVLNEGAHGYRFEGQYETPKVSVVKVKVSDLSIVSRLTLLDPSAIPAGGFIEHRGRKASLSADGSLGVVAVTEQGLIFLFDAVSMTLLETFDVSATSTEVRLAALSPDGSTIYAAYIDNDGTLDVIDVATGDVSTLALPTPELSSNRVGALTFGPDGRLYYARVTTSPGLSIYDPVSMMWVEQTVVEECYGVAFSGDGDTYYAYDDDIGEIYAFDIATDAILPNPADGGMTIPATDSSFGHCFIVTPL